MPLVFSIPKLNDFLVATHKSRHKPKINDATRTILAWTVSGKGVHYSAVGHGSKDDFIYVYHAAKVRDRWGQAKVTYYKSGPQKGQVKESVKPKIVDGGWTMRVFKIPADRVKKVKQFDRHFILELAK